MTPPRGARAPLQRESSDGQGTAKIQQGSAQAQEGEGQDHRRQSVAKRRRSRVGEFEEQLVIALGEGHPPRR